MAQAAKERETKNARLEFRVPGDLKKLIEDAASLQGVSVSDFLAATAHREAMKTIQERETIRLNREESTRFVETLLNPPEPNKALRSLMKGKSEALVH